MYKWKDDMNHPGYEPELICAQRSHHKWPRNCWQHHRPLGHHTKGIVMFKMFKLIHGHNAENLLASVITYLLHLQRQRGWFWQGNWYHWKCEEGEIWKCFNWKHTIASRDRKPKQATSINTCNVTIRNSRKYVAINSTFYHCKHKSRQHKSKKTTAISTYFYQTCKTRHRFVVQMTICCMCMIWFHNNCIDEIWDEVKSVAVWLCKVCRENPKLIDLNWISGGRTYITLIVGHWCWTSYYQYHPTYHDPHLVIKTSYKYQQC